MAESDREWQRVAESGRGQKTKAWTSFCRCDDPGIGDATGGASEPGSQKQTVLSCTELYRVVPSCTGGVLRFLSDSAHVVLLGKRRIPCVYGGIRALQMAPGQQALSAIKLYQAALRPGWQLPSVAIRIRSTLAGNTPIISKSLLP